MSRVAFYSLSDKRDRNPDAAEEFREGSFKYV